MTDAAVVTVDVKSNELCVGALHVISRQQQNSYNTNATFDACAVQTTPRKCARITGARCMVVENGARKKSVCTRLIGIVF